MSKSTSFKAGSFDLLAWSVPVGLLVVWQAAAMTGLLPRTVLPAPSAVGAAALRLIQSGDLQNNLLISFGRAITGLAIGGAIGFGFGLLSGLSRLGQRIFDPTFQMIRNIPHLALVPLVIIWFGVEDSARIFLVALGVFFPIYLNTFHGVRNVDPQLVEMARSYGLKPIDVIQRVILPGALPSILVGVRFALGVMWLTLIVAETVGASSGIGYMAMAAREFMQTDVIVLSILIYALLGKLADSATRLIEQRVLSWNAAYRHG